MLKSHLNSKYYVTIEHFHFDSVQCRANSFVVSINRIVWLVKIVLAKRVMHDEGATKSIRSLYGSCGALKNHLVRIPSSFDRQELQFMVYLMSDEHSDAQTSQFRENEIEKKVNINEQPAVECAFQHK